MQTQNNQQLIQENITSLELEKHKNQILLQGKIIGKQRNSLTDPTLFEYACAYYLSESEGKRCYVWKDMPALMKIERGFPLNDKGVDIVEEDFKNLIQCKYYEKSTIYWQSLSTFLAFPRLSEDMIAHKLTLMRSENSRISNDINRTICVKNLEDKIILNSYFLDFLKKCEDYIIPNSFEDPNFVLNSVQQEALLEILKTKRNIKIKIPTGLGKTVLSMFFIKQNLDEKFLILVPSLILLNQWYVEMIKFGITSIYKIGTDDNNKFDETNNSRIVICVYNSYDIIREHLDRFHKIFIDEAHHISTPRIYSEKIDIKETFITKIKDDILSMNKFVLLSATLDKDENFDFYSYGLREAIDNEFLCDYETVCPIFTGIPNDIDIAKYLIDKGETYCILYLPSIKKANDIKNAFNSLVKNSCEMIDCNTSPKDRKRILQDFEDGNIRFIANIRVLVEGFNCKKAKSIFFFNVPENDIFLIQSLGRILRKDDSKTKATIYVPYEDGKVKKMIRILMNEDTKFMKMVKDKNTYGYINFERVRKRENLLEFNEEIELKYELAFNSLGEMRLLPEIKQLILLDFVEKFERVPILIEEYNGVKIGSFYFHVKYEQTNSKIFQELLKNKIIRDDYERYLVEKEIRDSKPKYTLQEKKEMLLLFVKENNRLPFRNEYQLLFNIGSFYHKLKQGRYKEEFLNEILKENEIIRENYELFKLRQNEKSGKKNYTPEMKLILLTKFLREEKVIPKDEEIYGPDNINVGDFYSRLKLKNPPAKMFLDLLEEFSIVKNDYQRYLRGKKGREEKSKKNSEENIQKSSEINTKYTPPEKKDLLKQFINENGVVPKKGERYKNFNISQWYSDLKNKGYHKKIFDELISEIDVIRDDVNRSKRRKKPNVN